MGVKPEKPTLVMTSRSSDATKVIVSWLSPPAVGELEVTDVSVYIKSSDNQFYEVDDLCEENGQTVT